MEMLQKIYQKTRPLLFKIEPEKAHGLFLSTLKFGALPPISNQYGPALEVTLWGRKFPNPVGLGAGFDKDAEALHGSFGLGFGFVEAGTVTPRPQEGNPKPRIFRDPNNNAVINRMGFPGKGYGLFKANLSAFLSQKTKPQGVVGINIGMNKTQSEPEKDYMFLIRNLAPMGDYITVNISSPNTPGLRDLQEPDTFKSLILKLKEALKKSCGDHAPPLLVKLSPDITPQQQHDLAKICLDVKLDGLILTNTTLDRPENLPAEFAKEKGGLSGEPLRDKSTQLIHNMHKLTEGQIPIMGIGGIQSGLDALEKIKAGASLVQLYTGLIYGGPYVADKINKELLDLLAAEGYKNITEAVGADAC